MASLRRSKWSDNKKCIVNVRRGVFIENLTVFSSFIPKSGRKHSHTSSYTFPMTLITQGDHLIAEAWAACDPLCESFITPLKNVQRNVRAVIGQNKFIIFL